MNWQKQPERFIETEAAAIEFGEKEKPEEGTAEKLSSDDTDSSSSAVTKDPSEAKE